MMSFFQPQHSDAYRIREAAYWVRTMTNLIKAQARTAYFVTDAAEYNPVSEALAKLLEWQMGSATDVSRWNAACDLANATYNDFLGNSQAVVPAVPEVDRDSLIDLLFSYFTQERPSLSEEERQYAAAFYALTISDDSVPVLTVLAEQAVRRD
jgi:hypothetical protein